MPTFSAHDATLLAYHAFGSGDPVICLPGGPMRASAYLGDLGGLDSHLRLIMLDLRGTGGSATPQDPATYRCDRLVGDVEALREHLGLDRMNLLGHSAGGNLAALYAARYPERVNALALITPSTRAVGIPVTEQSLNEAAQLRAGEPWYPQAAAALAAIHAGRATEEDEQSIVPFFYGRWNATAQAHQAAENEQKNHEAAAANIAVGAFDPDATRAALAAFAAPVLLLGGELDLAQSPPLLAEFAELFPAARFVVQPGGGHFPWLDDPAWFTATVAPFFSLI